MRNLTTRIVMSAGFFGLVVGMFGPTAGNAEAGIVYDQPADFPATSSISAWTSTFDPSTYGSIYTAYDNFSLANSATVNSLTWQGFSFDATSDGTTNIPVQSFNVGFYADSSGTPGALLFSQNISFTASVAGTTDFFNNGQIDTIYNYSGTLTGGFTATAGTTYWLSIQGVTDYPAFWTWTSGKGGDGSSYQVENPAYGPNTGARQGDRAFSLSSVPEPSSLALCGIAGLIGLAVARSRQKRAGI